MENNIYLPFETEIIDIKKHTDLEYTFKVTFTGDVKPGQFFEVSLPKYGEAPISVSGIGEGTVDLTIRKVGRVTDEIFTYQEGQKLFMRGPYGNGFDLEDYRDQEVVVVAGGTGLSPVRGVVDYFANNIEEVKSFTLIAGFKSIDDVLFKEDLEKWKENINLIITVDNAEEGYSGNVGLVTEYIADLPLKDMDNTQVIIVGPPVMIKFVVQEFKERRLAEENIWISLERHMSCGLGKCGHCKIDSTYICLDGPVFNYSEGKNLQD